MFNIGNKVKLTENVLHEEYKGMTGIIKKIVKSKNVIEIICDNGKRYRAYPENVELL